MTANSTPQPKYNGPWVTIFKPNPGAAMRLVCFPHSGGRATMFHRWASRLPSVEICTVELPGRGRRSGERPFTSIGPLVSQAAAILTPYLDRPFAFFGHSLGALIAFELARLLRRARHRGAEHLFVSAHRAPQLPDRLPALHALSDASLIRELQKMEGTPQSVLEDPDLMAMLLPVVRADLAVCETYAYREEEPLECGISVFGGDEDFQTNQEELLAWRDQTRGAFNLQVFHGGHFFLNTAEAELMDALSAGLGAVEVERRRAQRPF